MVGEGGEGVELELNEDRNSFMMWLRIPKESYFTAPLLRFINSMGGPALVSRAEDIQAMKNMRDCSYKSQQDVYTKAFK
tara:strand:+ start:273 stop:509 length:237 start_codon:yes stop_codon:yes gene_type:complete